MTSEGLGGMFEGDSVGGRAEGLTCAEPEARTPIGASGNLVIVDSMRCPDMQQKVRQTNAVVTNNSLIAKLSPSPSSTRLG